MGKLKVKDSNAKQANKFDRSIEISAPILDPEVVRAIHSPKKTDMRHGGFKELLSTGDEADQQQKHLAHERQTQRSYAGSPSELTPVYEVNHLPSYIGISCAVSGYQNYGPRSPSPRPLDDSTNTRSESNISRASAGTRLGATPTPTSADGRHSRTGSPLKVGSGPLVSHFKLDRSKVSSIDQERRELAGLMAASNGDKLLLVSGDMSADNSAPVPPTESDRHHGAYVGARYSPMPDPADPAPRHIPLLGIDDELDPEVAAAEVEAEGKVVHRVASLYGEQFAESWQEELSNKTKSAGQGQENKAAKGPQGDSVRL